MRPSNRLQAALALAAFAFAAVGVVNLAGPSAASTTPSAASTTPAAVAPDRPAVPCYLPPIPFPSGCTPPAVG